MIYICCDTGMTLQVLPRHGEILPAVERHPHDGSLCGVQGEAPPDSPCSPHHPCRLPVTRVHAFPAPALPWKLPAWYAARSLSINGIFNPILFNPVVKIRQGCAITFGNKGFGGSILQKGFNFRPMLIEF